MEKAERIELEFLFHRFIPADIRKTTEAVALQTPTPRGASQLGNRCLQDVKKSSRVNSVYLRKATIKASSALDKMVEDGSLGPMGESLTVLRFLHLTTLLGLKASLAAKTLILS